MWEFSGSGPVVRLDIREVIYEGMTSQCGRSVFQFLVIRVDIEVLTCEGMTPKCIGKFFSSWLSEWI